MLSNFKYIPLCFGIFNIIINLDIPRHVTIYNSTKINTTNFKSYSIKTPHYSLVDEYQGPDLGHAQKCGGVKTSIGFHPKKTTQYNNKE